MSFFPFLRNGPGARRGIAPEVHVQGHRNCPVFGRKYEFEEHGLFDGGFLSPMTQIRMTHLNRYERPLRTDDVAMAFEHRVRV